VNGSHRHERLAGVHLADDEQRHLPPQRFASCFDNVGLGLEQFAPEVECRQRITLWNAQ
jgi:hypothetical protein